MDDPRRMTAPPPGRLADRDRVLELLRPSTTPVAAVDLVGMPGIGKSTVLGLVADAMAEEGWRVLRATPTARERGLPFVVLQDLLADLEPEVVKALPEPQRVALQAARLEVAMPPAGIDLRALGTALNRVLDRIAESTRVLLAIDDVVSIDQVSADALAFALRRLEQPEIAVLVTLAGDGVNPLGIEATSVELGGLEPEAIDRVVRSNLGIVLSSPDLRLVSEWSGGNPLWALEAARWLLSHPGGRPDARDVPPALSVEALLRARVDAQPEAVRRTLLVVALAGRTTLDELQAAAAGLGWDVELPLEASALVTHDDGRIRLAHPPLAAVIVDQWPTAEQRRVHAALADGQRDPVRRARHLAFAGDDADAGIARTIADAAERAASAGATQEALELAELAARRTPRDDLETLQTRHLELGRLALRVGDTIRADAALTAAADGPDRGTACRAVIATLHGRAATGPDAQTAIRRARVLARGDARLLAEVALALPGTEWQTYRHAGAARRLLERCEPDALLATAIGQEAAAAMELALPYPGERLDRAIAIEATRPVESVARSAAALRAWMDAFADDHAASRIEFEGLLERAREVGDEASIPLILRNLAHLEIRAGRWDVASSLAQETLRLAERTGRPGTAGFGHLQLGAIASLRGEVATAEAELAQAEEVARQLDQPFLAGLAAGRRGAMFLSLGDPGRAVTEFERSRRVLRDWGLRDPALTNWRGEHVEALIQLGRLDDARALVEEHAALAPARRRPVSGAIVERGRGLVLAADGALAAGAASAQASVAALRELQDPYELARSLHAAGSIERRSRRKSSAAALLEEAIAILDGLGAREWATRARDELRRVGLRPRASRSVTDIELQVARLAAAGLTNREIAARAFVSPRTVEDVLARVYDKLNVRGRTEMGIALARAGLASSTDATPD